MRARERTERGRDRKGRREEGHLETLKGKTGETHGSLMRSLMADSPAAAAMCSSTLSRSSQAAGWMSPYMSSVKMGAALISSERGAGDKLIT